MAAVWKLSVPGVQLECCGLEGVLMPGFLSGPGEVVDETRGRFSWGIDDDFLPLLSAQERDRLLSCPAGWAKDNDVVRAGLDATVRLVREGDRRVKALGIGAFTAAKWAGGKSLIGPATGIERTEFSYVTVTREIEAAGRAAVGLQVFPNAPWSDEGRIIARGAEEFLAWLYIVGYPVPPWLLDWPMAEIAESIIGRVGRGTPGLTGPGVSDERFPYDVADELDRLGPL